MNNEPVSIRILTRAVKTPTAAKAPLHADRPIAIGERWDFAALESGARTFHIPRKDRAAIARPRTGHCDRGAFPTSTPCFSPLHQT
jgi:hypothetical protein